MLDVICIPCPGVELDLLVKVEVIKPKNKLTNCRL